MPTELKAVLFRTSKLNETKDFFINELGFIIKESSFTHFVIHSKTIRFLFLKSDSDLEVELYISRSLSAYPEKKLTLHSRKKISGLVVHRDPNGMKIVISEARETKK